MDVDQSFKRKMIYECRNKKNKYECSYLRSVLIIMLIALQYGQWKNACERIKLNEVKSEVEESIKESRGCLN